MCTLCVCIYFPPILSFPLSFSLNLSLPYFFHCEPYKLSTVVASCYLYDASSPECNYSKQPGKVLYFTLQTHSYCFPRPPLVFFEREKKHNVCISIVQKALFGSGCIFITTHSDISSDPLSTHAYS